MGNFYILDKNRKVVPVRSEITWARFFENSKRIVCQETVGRFWISTVFLGLDHDFRMASLIHESGGGIPVGFYEPLVFETMAFAKDGKDVYQRRYRSWTEAEQGHAHACRLFVRYERALQHKEAVLARLEREL